MTRVLVVEDSPAIAVLLRRRLEMADHEVENATSGTEALASLDRNGLPGIVLLDVVMPGMSGIETLGAIKAADPSLPVLLVTAQHLSHSDTKGADAVVSKPIDFDQLLELIEQLVL